jgi:hypothetical protein
MGRTLFIFALSILLIPLACSKKPESAARVEIIDGIEYVHNTGTPLDPEKSATFEEELSIGGEKYEMLSQPGSFVVDMEGRIFVADNQDQSIKAFDSNGEFIRSIGRKGEGPGEFSYVGYQTFLPDGKLLVMDSMAMRLNLFDPEGTNLRSYHWTHRPGRLLFATESACVMAEYVFGEGDDALEERKLFVKKFDFEGNEILSFGEFRAEEMKIHRESRSGGGGIVFGISVPHSPHSLFTVDQADQHLYHCVNDEYMIEVFDKDGHVFRRIDRPYEPLPFTGKDAEEFRSRYEERGSEGLKKMVQGMAMPAVKTITPRMLVDDGGNLWVETYEQKEEGEEVFTAYDIFDPDGNYEAKIWVEMKPEIFMNGKMYSFRTDEDTGYRFVKRYRVLWSE